TLTQEGAEFFRQALLHGRMPAFVKYTLNFAGRIPSIKIRIHGDRSAFYEEVKTHYSWVSWRETDEHYWFYDVRTYEEIRTEFTSEQSSVIPKQINPSALLTHALTPDDITKNTIWVDLSQLAFPELDVTVNANVNFEDDPVYSVRVFLSYDQQDEVRNVHVKG